MQTRNLFAYVLASCTIMGSTYAPAEDAQQITPVDSTQQNSAFEYSARKILGYASESRAALDDNNTQDAIDDLVMASEELGRIHDIKSYMEANGVMFGRVFYGDSRSYYIPVADDTYAVRSYKQGPFWSGKKGMAVSDVQLVLVNISIDPEKAAQHIHTAQKDIAHKDYSKAQTELNDLLEESIRTVASSEQPFTRLQDNVYLTRVLLAQRNYDGARYALKHAKSALDDYAKTLAKPDARVNSMKLEIEALDKTIQQRDPSMLKQAEQKVEKWWKELKSWSSKNT